MTALDIIAAHLNMSVDEVRAVLEAADSAAYAMEMNLEQWFPDFADMELTEMGEGTEEAVRKAVTDPSSAFPWGDLDR